MSEIDPTLPRRNENAPQKPNWDAIFTQSFLLSQGNPQAQHRIFLALALGPLKGEKPGRDDLARHEGAARYGAGLAHRGAHTKTIVADKPESTDAELQAKTLALDMQQVFGDPSLESLSQDEEENLYLWFRELLWSFVEQDHKYLSRFTGRPVKSAVRDKWSSFTIDFCLLKRGTPPFSYASLAEPVQQMCDALGALLEAGALEDAGPRRKLKKVIRAYLSKHPKLGEEDKKRLLALRAAL